jgi:uncharacterized metal-binding protein YceD (DUF177 family)
MKIEFRRIGSTPKEFDVTDGGITFKGVVEFQKRNLIVLNANILGNLEIDCDVCAKSFDIMLDEKVNLLLSDGVYEGEDDTLDVVEIFESNGQTFIDFEEILHSEIEIIKNDYYKCDECQALNA